MKHALKGFPLLLIVGAVSGIFLAFLCSWVLCMRPMAEGTGPVVSRPVAPVSPTVPQIPTPEYLVKEGKLYDANGRLLLSDMHQAGLALDVCGEVEGLHFYAMVGDKALFLEACGAMGGRMWQYDAAARRFSPREVAFSFGRGTESPDHRYQVSLSVENRETEARAYILKDFLLDTETAIGALPSRWSYTQTMSEFDEGPLGMARWVEGVAYLSVFDGSVSVADFAETREPLFEKAVTVSSSTNFAALEGSYRVENGKLYQGRHRQLLSADVQKAGLDHSECGDGDLHVYAEIEGKIFFTESCAIAQTRGQLWMYDASTLRFTRRNLVPGLLGIAASPDGRYRLSLADIGGEVEARQLVVMDLLRDTEKRVGSLPEKWSYSASLSEFIGAPLGKGRWEKGKFIVSVHDVSTRLPYAGEEDDVRPVLFEKTISLP